MGDAGANIDPIYEARDRQIWEMIHRAPQIEIDEEADAAYVRISNRPIERTQEIITDGILLDFDVDRELVRVEVLDLRRVGEGPIPICGAWSQD
jgi:uncharacterized protein YuzE